MARAISWVIPAQIFNLPSHPMVVQFLIRLELLLLSWLAHVRLSKSLGEYFGKQARSSSVRNQAPDSAPTLISSYYLLITASQFHLPFYSSRLLPNTFATIIVIHAYAEWFKGNAKRAATCLVFTTAIFRCDALLLLFTVGLTMLLRRQMSIAEAITTGVLTGVSSLVLTVPLDSLLWRRPIWPEFEVWWFNAVDNRSSEWGTMPFHWYISAALPKGLLLTALLIPLAFARLPEYIHTRAILYFQEPKQSNQSNGQHFVGGMFDQCLLPFFTPVCGFVLMYSFLPHKEIRFIFPAIPMLNVCAAYGMSRLHQVAFPDSNKQNTKQNSNDVHFPSLIARGMYLCGIGAIACTMLGSMMFVMLSAKNYPGGDALALLRQHLEASLPSPSTQSHGLPSSSLGISRNIAENKRRIRTWENVYVHIDVAAAMTGVSLYGQRHASHRSLDGDNEVPEGPFRIDKSGFEELNSIMNTDTAYTHLVTEQESVRGYHIVGTIQGHPRLDLRRLRIATEDALFVLQQDGW